MTMRRLAALLSLLALVNSGAAKAADFDQRVEELLVWISGQTGYAVGDVSVTVAFAEPALINIVTYGTAYTGQSDIQAMAIGNAIILPDWFVLGVNDDVLVHELVHVLQFANDARFACQSLREREAYTIQSAFVAETGIGTAPARWFVTLLSCPTNPWDADLTR